MFHAVHVIACLIAAAVCARVARNDQRERADWAAALGCCFAAMFIADAILVFFR
jgi:hypothetical protein